MQRDDVVPVRRIVTFHLNDLSSLLLRCRRCVLCARAFPVRGITGL
jgi:hypothetical protein